MRASTLRAAAAAALMAVLAPLAADVSMDVYGMLYRSSANWARKYSILEEVAASENPASGDILASALREAVGMERESLTPIEREYYDRILRLACAGLGVLRRVESAPDVFAVARSKLDALVRAEAVIALGRMRSLAHLEEITRMLATANLRAGEDREAEEKLAYACIVALGKMGDLRGWRDVFVASRGWYSQRTRDAAEQSLISMVPDPAPAIRSIIELEEPVLGEQALKYHMASRAMDASKADMAAYAFWSGFNKAARDQREKAAAKSLRMSALGYLASLGDQEAKRVPDYRAAWPTVDGDERILILNALGVNATDAAAGLLYVIIEELDQARRIGNVKEDTDRLAKAALQNAALTGKKSLIPAVIAVTDNPKWSSGVLIFAYEALSALEAR